MAMATNIVVFRVMTSVIW